MTPIKICRVIILKDSASGIHERLAGRWNQMQDTYQPDLLQTPGMKTRK